jgi:hypothetical protein
MAQKTGTRTSGIETSARYRRRRAAKRLAEEKSWEERSGPVISAKLPAGSALSAESPGALA